MGLSKRCCKTARRPLSANGMLSPNHHPTTVFVLAHLFVMLIGGAPVHTLACSSHQLCSRSCDSEAGLPHRHRQSSHCLLAGWPPKPRPQHAWGGACKGLTMPLPSTSTGDTTEASLPGAPRLSGQSYTRSSKSATVTIMSQGSLHVICNPHRKLPILYRRELSDKTTAARKWHRPLRGPRSLGLEAHAVAIHCPHCLQRK